MNVRFRQAGKKFNREWIFRNTELDIHPGDKVVLLGPNGSGKSTFLQVAGGYQSITEGSIQWETNGVNVAPEEVFHHLAISAPYLELPEEFTLRELIDFHFRFKSRTNGMTDQELIALSGLASQQDRQVRNYSSGMKQRVRLLLAICSDTPMLLLDEPCSNLDSTAIEWYQSLLERFTIGRTVIVGSNRQEHEYRICNRQIDLLQWKK